MQISGAKKLDSDFASQKKNSACLMQSSLNLTLIQNKIRENRGFKYVFVTKDDFQNYPLIIFPRCIFFLYLKTLTMRLCTLCKIVSMSKQYSGTVGLKTKINLATRYIIKGSFKPSQSETERHFFRHFCCVANLSFFTGKPELQLWDDDVLFSLGSLHRHCTLGGVARK